MNTINNKKIAIVVEELTQLGGAERILDCLIEMFPEAPIFTLVWDKEKTLHRYDAKDVRTSFIQKMPWGVKRYKWYLSLMPKAIESLDLKNFDIIISVTSALVKGIKTDEEQIHICYCNTPTRYLWIESSSYVKSAPIPFFIRPFMPYVIKKLKKWDLKASQRPNYFIANSENVKKRIKKYYNRDSFIIYPNVETEKFFNNQKKENYFLLVSRIEPYKKVDLVIDAFRNLKENLVIVGGGSKLLDMKLSSPKNVKFLGRQSDEQLAELYARAKAFIFPQEEDFGITPVESMASGTPVIAYKRGGALETVLEGKTGEFFYPQTVEALRKVIQNFKKEKYSKHNLRAQAQKFDQKVFKKKIMEYIINTKLKIKNDK